MLAPGLAHAMVAQHFVLGLFPHLLVYFGGLLKKLLFFGRTLLLRLCASKRVLVQEVGSRASKRFAGAAFRARDVCGSSVTFRWPTKEAFVLRTDVAFAGMG